MNEQTLGLKLLHSSELGGGKHEHDQIRVKMLPKKFQNETRKTQEKSRGRGSVEHHLLLLFLGFRAEDLLDGAEPLALLPHGATPRSSSKQSPWHLERSKQVTNQTTYLETTGVKPHTSLSEEETPKSSRGSKGKEGGRLETRV